MLGFIVEGLVILLLLITIGYCVLLNRRLVRLRTSEDAMRATIGELVHATDAAQVAIVHLKESAAGTDRRLGLKVKQAERLLADLTLNVEAGDHVVGRLAKVVAAARGGEVETETSSSGPESVPEREASTGRREVPLRVAIARDATATAASETSVTPKSVQGRILEKFRMTSDMRLTGSAA